MEQARSTGAKPGFPAADSQRETELLDRWVAAKRERDYETSDKIQDELRSQHGIDPNKARPSKRAREEMAQKPAVMTPMTNELLDRWTEAKRDMDFATADRIRQDLRGMGIDPDSVRPSQKVTSARHAPGTKEPPKPG